MKSHKPHLLQKMITKLKGVPLASGHGDNGATHVEPHKHGVHVTIAIGGHGKPEEGSPEEEAKESPAMEESEDEDLGMNAAFGGFKRPGHKFGKK